jgi:hypothetical protein
VCLYVYPAIVVRQQLGENPPIVTRQRLGINVTEVRNTHVTIEVLLDASFSMWPLSYQGMYEICPSQNFLFKEKEIRLKIHFIQASSYLLRGYPEAQVVTVIFLRDGEYRSKQYLQLSPPRELLPR